jgi:Histidine kinase
MKRLLTFLFRLPQAPSWRQLPVNLGKVALSGVLLGPFIALALGLVLNVPIGNALAHPVWFLAYSCAIGAVFATTFYTTCALPQMYLAPLFKPYPGAVRMLLRILVGAAGGSLGAIIAMAAITDVLHVRLVAGPTLRQIIVLDAFIGGGIAVLVSVFAMRGLRIRTAEEAAARAQAKALQAQINPHFFFNTLNTVNALIDSDPGAAKQVVSRLADMFRYTLRCSGGQLVTLPQELEFVRSHLQIEHARFGNRLQYELPERPDAFPLPGLVLQPLVENAIRHGVAQRLKGGQIQVRLEPNGSRYRLRVRNQYEPGNGPPDLSAENLYREGHALANIRERLQLLYGDRAGLEIHETGGDWVESVLTLPLEKPMEMK